LTRKACVAIAVLIGALMMSSAAGAQYQPGQPGLVLTPSTTTPGGAVTALGFGCPPGSIVTITIDGKVVGTTVAADDGKGSFQVPITAPTTPGQFTVTATCGVTIVSSILTVIAAPTTAAVLPQTGSDSTLSLSRLGLVLIAGGGLLILAVRKRREA
jgi:LPXTG-motif cell wall-anchored protein